MKSLIITALQEWNNTKNQRTKLQSLYFMLIIVAIIASGLLSLIAPYWSRFAAYAAVTIAIVYAINGITWALSEAFIVPKIPKASSSKKIAEVGAT